jgi:hypothetical protein
MCRFFLSTIPFVVVSKNTRFHGEGHEFESMLEIVD